MSDGQAQVATFRAFVGDLPEGAEEGGEPPCHAPLPLLVFNVSLLFLLPLAMDSMSC